MALVGVCNIYKYILSEQKIKMEKNMHNFNVGMEGKVSFFAIFLYKLKYTNSFILYLLAKVQQCVYL